VSGRLGLWDGLLFFLFPFPISGAIIVDSAHLPFSGQRHFREAARMRLPPGGGGGTCVLLSFFPFRAIDEFMTQPLSFSFLILAARGCMDLFFFFDGILPLSFWGEYECYLPLVTMGFPVNARLFFPFPPAALHLRRRGPPFPSGAAA